MDISAWLDGLGPSRYAGTFAENEIDGEIPRDLTAEDLKELGEAQEAFRGMGMAPWLDRANRLSQGGG